ncbi:hypothetical protein [Snodgrassella sp. ESL0324]|uniref:hypothetical protein n=1 Tax=Snodgrassella sp. ESL0324 TaxID=2705033 RepID=UPI0015816045|nr:hypothetical protein [Snodgrassella sp. ESL0324]NUF09439.1 hypothetical protein [Snodgrassella sp. ESL0324]
MKILLLLLILSLSGCLNSNNDSEQDKIKNLEEQRIITDTTEITVRIPSKVSGKKLEIALPRCMFGFSIKNKIIDGIVEQKAAAIIFALPTLSGFPNDEEAIHRCPDFSKPVVGLSFAPLYRNIKAEKLEYGNHWFKRENYRFRLKEKKNNQELYYIGISGKQTMFVNKSETNQQDLRIDFWPFDVKDEYNAFPHQIDIYSVLDEEFSVTYTVYSSRFLHGKYKPPVSQNYFADGLIQIYKHNESLLDHPEIQLGFIQNNNRILDYIHQHSKVVTDQNH